MNVSCPDCRSIFRVDPAKVPSGGVRARCSVCSGIIPIPAPTGMNTPVTSTPRAATPPGESPAQTRPRAGPQSQGGWDPAPFPSPPGPRPSTPPAPRAPSPASQQRAPFPTSSPLPPVPSQTPTALRPRQGPVERAAASATATPSKPASPIPAFTPPPAPPYVPGSARPAPPERSSATPRTQTAATASPVAPSPAIGRTGAVARRPLNPFLSRDPNQRAKRLARALVSDIITYHPAKHAEGLRDGTLKQLFREEIKKSFEEYIAQVGQQLAESTTYFQEALNEVLGAGKKIF